MSITAKRLAQIVASGAVSYGRTRAEQRAIYVQFANAMCEALDKTTNAREREYLDALTDELAARIDYENENTDLKVD